MVIALDVCKPCGRLEAERRFCFTWSLWPLRCLHSYPKSRKKGCSTPCPHFNISITQRSRGQSAVAGAAYQSGEKLFSEYDQKGKSYSEKRGIVFAEILLPSNAPPEYKDRSTLWNAAEKIEKQWNAQLARRIVLALPREVPPEQYPAMLREFCQEHFVSKGMCVDYAIHDKGDGNPHAHILLTMRAMDEQGHWLPKSRKVYDLDENGERIRLPSGNWKTHKESTVDWNEQSKAELWRHGWEITTNRFLEKNGRSERVDLRSFERQGLDYAPTIHLGPAVTQMEKRGVRTELGNYNREIRRMNRKLYGLRKTIEERQSQLAELHEKRDLEESRERPLSELLMDYLDERQGEREDWSLYAQRKGTATDLKKISLAVAYLQTHEINTMTDLENHVAEKEAALNEIRNTVRGKEKRIRDIDALGQALKTVRQVEPLQKEKNSIILKKWRDEYYRQHKDDLDAYYRAKRLILKFYSDGKAPTQALSKERNRLSAELEEIRPRLDALNDELEQMNIVRICLTPQKSKDEPKREMENAHIPEKRVITTPKQERASALGRLREKQQEVNEREQRKKTSHTKDHSAEL